MDTLIEKYVSETFAYSFVCDVRILRVKLFIAYKKMVSTLGKKS